MLLGLAVGGCIVPLEPDYGVPDTGCLDRDGDGWSPGDCDDDDPARHPGADETAGDGVDSNCDGDDDP